jgi:3-oxoacyl-(acyl-carrier-protein) synthase
MHAMLSLHSGTLPPMINCDDPVCGCTPAIVREKRTANIRRALVWNSDRGMKNAAVLIAACDG